jgi:hypothetical protein
VVFIWIGLAHMDIRPANMFIAPALTVQTVVSPPHQNVNESLSQTHSLSQCTPPSGYLTPRYSQGTSAQSSLFPPSMCAPPMAIATTGNGTTLRRHSSFPPLPHPTTFPPPISCRENSQEVGCEMQGNSIMEMQSNLDDSLNFTQQSDIGYEYSQSSCVGNGQFLSCPGTPLEELPPIEMSQPEEIFEHYRNRNSSTIQSHEINENLSNGNWIVKLGDLGLCCRFDDYSLLNDGEQRYLPQEVLLELRPLDFTKADIFSLGASLYEMCRGRVLDASGEEWRLLRDGRFQSQLESYEQTRCGNDLLYGQLMRYSPDVREVLKQVSFSTPLYILTFILMLTDRHYIQIPLNDHQQHISRILQPIIKESQILNLT